MGSIDNNSLKRGKDAVNGEAFQPPGLLDSEANANSAFISGCRNCGADSGQRIFVAAEFALVSLRRTRVQQLIEQKRTGARIVADLQSNLDELLPAVQLGVTLASLTLGWLGEPFVARFLVPWLSLLPHARFYAGIVSAVLAFSLITYLEVIFGELVPKSLALRQGDKVALAIAGPMNFFMQLTRPLVRFMNASAEFVLRLFRLSRVPEGTAHSPEELKLITTATRRMGLLPEKLEMIIHRVLDLDTITVREIMTPRQRIFSLPADLPLAEANARITQVQRSRIPVFDPEQGPEHIVGVVYAKDLARVMHFRAIIQAAPRPGSIRDGESEMQLRQLMHDVIIVPETKVVSDLLTEFQTRRRHLAIVVDEFGSITGLVTVEDALEQIVGEMEDEFDVRDSSMQTLSSGTLVLHGNVTLLDLESQMGSSAARWRRRDFSRISTGAYAENSQRGRLDRAGRAKIYRGRNAGPAYHPGAR